MKIISGYLKNGRLLIFNNPTIVRPTTHKVRESIFNILANNIDIEGKVVLDIFAGTGILGFESISRGAERVIFFERSLPVFKDLLKNAAYLKVLVNSNFIFKDFFLQKDWFLGKVDIVFLDPPYNKNIIPDSLMHICDLGVLRDGSIIVCEHYYGDVFSHPGTLTKIFQKRYGNIMVVLFKFSS